MLGTFAMYYGEPRTPTESDLQLIEGAGRVAVIAIEGERARIALEMASEEIKRSEAELRTIIDAIIETALAQCQGRVSGFNAPVSASAGLRWGQGGEISQAG